MRILLRRWTTQFFDLCGGLAGAEPGPEVFEEVEDRGVLPGVLFLPGVLGVVMADRLAD